MAWLAQNRGARAPETPKCRSSWEAVRASRGSSSGRQTIIVRIVAVGVTTGVLAAVVLVAGAAGVPLRGVTVGTRRPKRLSGVAAPLVAVMGIASFDVGAFWARGNDRPTGCMGRVRGNTVVRGGAGGAVRPGVAARRGCRPA